MEKKRKPGRPKKNNFEVHAFSIRLPLELYLNLNHLAVDARVSINDVINMAMKEFMKKKPEPTLIHKTVRASLP